MLIIFSFLFLNLDTVLIQLVENVPAFDNLSEDK